MNVSYNQYKFYNGGKGKAKANWKCHLHTFRNPKSIQHKIYYKSHLFEHTTLQQ